MKKNSKKKYFSENSKKIFQKNKKNIRKMNKLKNKILGKKRNFCFCRKCLKINHGVFFVQN